MPALRAVTIDAAWQVFMDDQVGSIVPGKRLILWCFLITHSLRITFVQSEWIGPLSMARRYTSVFELS